MKLISKQRVVLWALLIASLGSNFQLWNVAAERDANARVYKVQVDLYKTEALARNVQYQLVRTELIEMQKKLTDRDRRIALAVARERAALLKLRQAEAAK